VRFSVRHVTRFRPMACTHFEMRYNDNHCFGLVCNKLLCLVQCLCLSEYVNNYYVNHPWYVYAVHDECVNITVRISETR